MNKSSSCAIKKENESMLLLKHLSWVILTIIFVSIETMSISIIKNKKLHNKCDCFGRKTETTATICTENHWLFSYYKNHGLKKEMNWRKEKKIDDQWMVEKTKVYALRFVPFVKASHQKYKTLSVQLLTLPFNTNKSNRIIIAVLKHF